MVTVIYCYWEGATPKVYWLSLQTNQLGPRIQKSREVDNLRQIGFPRFSPGNFEVDTALRCYQDFQGPCSNDGKNGPRKQQVSEEFQVFFFGTFTNLLFLLGRRLTLKDSPNSTYVRMSKGKACRFFDSNIVRVRLGVNE